MADPARHHTVSWGVTRDGQVLPVLHYTRGSAESAIGWLDDPERYRVVRVQLTVLPDATDA